MYGRSLLRWLSAVVLHASLFAVIAAFGFVLLVDDRQVVKETLLESGIYNDFAPTVMAPNIEQSRTQPNALPLHDEQVRIIVYNAFAPRTLQTKTEKVIDDIYAWLDGSSKDLAFRYDFSEQASAAVQGIATYAANRVMSLPVCTESPGEINVFSVECRPDGITHEYIEELILTDLQDTSILEKTSYSADDLPKTADGKALQEKYSFLPLLYRVMQNSVIPALLILLFSAVVFVLARRPFTRGIRSLGRDLLSNGLMIIALTFVFGFVVPKYSDAFSLQGSDTIQLLNRVMDSYIHKFDILIINVAIQVAAAGFGLLVLVRINSHVGGYKDLDVRTGLTSSMITPHKITRPSESTVPPIQTSEQSRNKKSSTQKSSKYRKIKL